MKPSKYISRIAKTNIKKKRQRTWLSLTAICLSTAIIFTSTTLFKNVYSFSKNTDYETIGNYHYAAYVSEEVSESNRLTITQDIDTGYYGKYEQQLLNLRSLSSDSQETPLPFVIKDGSLPSNDHEIMVSDRWNKKVGDSLTLSLGQIEYEADERNLYHFSESIDFSSLNNLTERTYTVCAVYADNDAFSSTHPNIDLIYTYGPSNEMGVYYVKDELVHLSDSFQFTMDKLQADPLQAITNMDVVSNDSVKNYLQDTTVLLAMFIIIAVIGICMSLISVHNVVLISDRDRKKELGLLKSIGATPKEIQKLLQIELIVLGVLGAFLGIVLGSVVSYFVLNLFIDKIYVAFHIGMILNPIILIFSWIAGVLLMYVSGMKAYRQYITSSAISDLKDFSYEYGLPIKPTATRRKGFSWKMFIIYNGRMKKQTKNIFRSFALLLATTVLFISIFLSNVIYVNKYVNKGYDFDVTNYHSTISSEGGLWEVDPNVSYALYDKENEKQIDANYFYAERLLISGSFWTRLDAYNSDLVDAYKSVSRLEFKTSMDTYGETFCNLYQFPAALDKVQIEEIKPYIVEGSVDILTSKDVIAIFSENDRLGAQLCSNFNVGDEVAYTPSDNVNLKKEITAIAIIPEEACDKLHFNYKDYPRVMALSLETMVATGDGQSMSEHIYIDLRNTSTASAVQDVISQTLAQTNCTDRYVMDSIAITVETNRFATFIIEALLYPLFLMLFIVSLMNIHNVFIGNVHLKRNDISIMKSVGMTVSQLNSLFTFEYVEGYINASALVTAIFIPAAIIESRLNIASSFDFAANIFGTLLVSIMLLGIILTAPLVILSLRRIKRILPIENLKDID